MGLALDNNSAQTDIAEQIGYTECALQFVTKGGRGGGRCPELLLHRRLLLHRHGDAAAVVTVNLDT